MTQESQSSVKKQDELFPEVFDDYSAFLKAAVREYYDRGWKHRRGNFIALLIASGQVLSMAADSVKDGSGFRRRPWARPEWWRSGSRSDTRSPVRSGSC